MANPKCTVAGCDRVARSKSAEWCEAHYYRVRRTGRLDRPAPRNQSVCTVLDCESLAASRGLCRMHYQRYRKHGDPSVRLYVVGETGEAHPGWKADAVTYSGAHMRVRAQRGDAASYACQDCGEPAQQWSYDHADPNELVSKEGPYGPDVDHYEPRCVPCHKTFDLLILARRHHPGAQ